MILLIIVVWQKEFLKKNLASARTSVHDIVIYPSYDCHVITHHRETHLTATADHHDQAASPPPQRLTHPRPDFNTPQAAVLIREYRHKIKVSARFCSSCQTLASLNFIAPSMISEATPPHNCPKTDTRASTASNCMLNTYVQKMVYRKLYLNVADVDHLSTFTYPIDTALSAIPP